MHLSDAHVEALNISTHPPCPIEDLVPSKADGTSYAPSVEPDPPTTNGSYSDAVKSNTGTSPKPSDYKDRIRELELDNDLAFRIINRTVTGLGRPPPRLAYMRKFWEGLENMSRYWDCSLDNYYTANYEDDEQKSPKRQKVDSHPPTPDSMAATPGTSPPAVITPQKGKADDEGANDAAGNEDQVKAPETATKRELGVVIDNFLQSVSTKPIPDARPRKRYKGRRTATGNDMPDNFRADTVKAFVEGVVWPFQMTVLAPRVMPRVHFNKLILPIRQTAVVHRIPQDRTRARRGFTEGPIISIQTRPETDFVKTSEEEQRLTSRLDLLREIGALLQLAQERYREGKTEVKPGEGQWWTTKPRWGGGLGGEAQIEVGNTDVLQAAEDLLGSFKDRAGAGVNTGRMRKTPAMLWKELKCGKGFWDAKTEYKAIGKEPGSLCDELFLVSSINHHISIVKLTVHSAYLDYLDAPTLPCPLPEDPGWCRPNLQRSKWYDLFSKDDRLELFRGLWSIMSYLTRETGPEVQSKSKSDVPVSEN
ncbi:uncharacterized protein LTR77_006290 [Saxophila tyrrhenica]|uniref:Uncharacterized protein n=1 Tax=Saxophila tyrrhenica TaxID=1690608 RepID=A0AAV9P9L7_9PEZI|nr:hypothetical protein LTR77_006290 [Saxophila tyrrhenica]